VSTIEGISIAWCSRPGKRFGDEAAMFDQRRAEVHAFERGIDVGDVLARDDDVVRGQLAREVGDGLVEAERVGRAVDGDADRFQLRVSLLGHAVFSEARDDLDPVAGRVERLGEQTHFRLLAADDEPGEDEQDADRSGVGSECGAQSPTLKTIWRNSGRSPTSFAMNLGASS
jgi:hypothetical protein